MCENQNLATEAIGRSIAVFAGTLKNNEHDYAADAVCDDVVGIAVLHDDDTGVGDDSDSATCKVRQVWD